MPLIRIAINMWPHHRISTRTTTTPATTTTPTSSTIAMVMVMMMIFTAKSERSITIPSSNDPSSSVFCYANPAKENDRFRFALTLPLLTPRTHTQTHTKLMFPYLFSKFTVIAARWKSFYFRLTIAYFVFAHSTLALALFARARELSLSVYVYRMSTERDTK